MDLHRHHRHHRVERLAKFIISTSIQTRFARGKFVPQFPVGGSNTAKYELYPHEPSRIAKYVSASVMACLGLRGRDMFDTID